MSNKEVFKKKRVYIGYLLVILWMVVIFYFSSRSGDVSAYQSNEFNEILKNSVPEVYSVVDNMVKVGFKIFSIRKLAHMFLYMMLTILLYIPTKGVFEKYKQSLIMTIGVSISYAILDEIHQLFVPGRSGQIQDVMIDFIGIIVGIMMIMLFYKLRNILRKDNECSGKL